jgi:hypothetical protein
MPLAFGNSFLKKQLDKANLCVLVLFVYLAGDNAYVQTPYMCTRWRKAAEAAKDAFKYFHSQVRINIESAFGQLVLRKPMPLIVSVQKTDASWLRCTSFINSAKLTISGVIVTYIIKMYFIRSFVPTF